jgi:hypothetical protein
MCAGGTVVSFHHGDLTKIKHAWGNRLDGEFPP